MDFAFPKPALETARQQGLSNPRQRRTDMIAWAKRGCLDCDPDSGPPEKKKVRLPTDSVSLLLLKSNIFTNLT